jgi:hypothetical protein
MIFGWPPMAAFTKFRENPSTGSKVGKGPTDGMVMLMILHFIVKNEK